MRDIAGVHRNGHQKVSSLELKMAPLLPHCVEAEALEGRNESSRSNSAELAHGSFIQIESQ